MITEKMRPVMEAALGDRYKEGDYDVHLQPLYDLHFGKGWDFGIIKTSEIKYVYIVSGIALLMLLLASINFTTLSIGKSFTRAKEVGVRKVVGSSRKQIIFQFLGESILMTFFGLAIGLFIAYSVLPWFNQLSGVDLAINLGWKDVLIFISIGFVVGALSGSYPALVISGFQSYRILKSDFGRSLKKQNLRKALVTVQFVIAVVFISTSLLMLQQMRFLLNKDLGFDRDQLVNVVVESDNSRGLQHTAESAIEQGEKLKKVLAHLPGVINVGFSTNKFEGHSWIRVGSSEKGKEDETVMLSATFIDPGFISTLRLEMAEGRNFTDLNSADYKNAVIVNETLAKELGWDNPLTEKLPGRYSSHEIVGVVKDFNYESMHSKIRPLFMTMNPTFLFEAMNQLSMESMIETNMFIRIKAGDVQATIKSIEQATGSLFPDEPFRFEFVNDAIQKQYEKERSLNKIISTATVLALIVSSLGLFGLSHLTLSARTKEIGMRKVLGASFIGLFIHLTREYVFMIITAVVIAVPIAYIFIQKWLEGFEFRITVMPQNFLVGILLTLVVCVMTIGYITLKSITKRPVEALRYE